MQWSAIMALINQKTVALAFAVLLGCVTAQANAACDAYEATNLSHQYSGKPLDATLKASIKNELGVVVVQTGALFPRDYNPDRVRIETTMKEGVEIITRIYCG